MARGRAPPSRRGSGFEAPQPFWGLTAAARAARRARGALCDRHCWSICEKNSAAGSCTSGPVCAAARRAMPSLRAAWCVAGLPWARCRRPARVAARRWSYSHLSGAFKIGQENVVACGSCPGAAYGAAEAVDGPNGFLWTCSSPLGSADCAVFALTAEKTSSGACMCGEVMMVLQPAVLPLRAAGGVALEGMGLRVPSSPLSSLPSSPCPVVHSPPGVASGPSHQCLCSITTCVAVPLMPQSLGVLKPWVLLIQSGPPSSGDAYAGKAGTTGLLSGLRKPVGTVYPTPSWSVYDNVCVTGRVCLSSAWGSRFQGSCYALPMAMSSNGFHYSAAHCKQLHTHAAAHSCTAHTARGSPRSRTPDERARRMEAEGASIHDAGSNSLLLAALHS